MQILKIRQTPPEVLGKYYDYNEGIEYRIKKCADEYAAFDEILSAIETPRYRLPRVNKLLLYPLLNITKETINISNHTKPVCKVLAVNKNNKKLLSEYNKNKITLIANNNDYNNLSKNQKKIIDVDLNSSNIYSTIFEQVGNIDKTKGTLFI